MEGEVWSAFAHDPRDPAAAPLRASDADREVIHGVLAEAFADGRLDRGEYDERSSSVLGARTLGDLPPIVADLVPAVPARRASGRVPLVAATTDDIQRRAREHWEEERRRAVGAFIGVSLITWTVWLAVNWMDFTPFPFPWPAIVTAALLANLVKVVSSRSAVIASEVRRLEKKQAKELEKKQRGQ